MSELCEKHRKGYEPLKLGILTPLCPLCLQAENARFKKNYAIIEECAPPDWPRTDFVEHIFNLWSNGVEAENKRLREALEKYGEHQTGCKKLVFSHNCVCNCGYEQALKNK